MPSEPELVSCPQCGAAVLSSGLADHGVAHHGTRRPAPVSLAAAALLLAAAFCAWFVIQPLGGVLNLFGEGGGGRLIAALLLMVLLIVGSYGLAFLLIARMLWRGDRAGRILAPCLAGSVGLALLATGSDELSARAIEAASVAVILATTLAPSSSTWFTGPFALRRSEPTSVVVARSMVGAAGWFAAIAAGALWIGTSASADLAPKAVAYSSAAFLTLGSIGGLARRSSAARRAATVGLLIGGTASLWLGDVSGATLILLTPNLVALGCLWLSPDVSSWFDGSEPLGPSSTVPSAGQVVVVHEVVPVSCADVIEAVRSAGGRHLETAGNVATLSVADAFIHAESLTETSAELTVRAPTLDATRHAIAVARTAAITRQVPAVSAAATTPLNPVAVDVDAAAPITTTIPRITPVPVRPAVSIVSADGTSWPVDRPLLLGRAPTGGPADAREVALADPTMSISKTHALLRPIDDGVLVEDLHSTNGTRILADGAESAVEPQQPKPAHVGDTVVLGDVALHVRRAAPS